MFGYHLQMKDKNSILWQRVNKTVIRATHFKVTNVNAGLIYEFKVAAENAAGVSVFSKASDAVLAIDACGECDTKIWNFFVTTFKIDFKLNSCFSLSCFYRTTFKLAHY